MGLMMPDDRTTTLPQLVVSARRSLVFGTICLIPNNSKKQKLADRKGGKAADIIMLDNMALELMRQAVKMTPRTAKSSEASGNITLQTIRAVAETGVDYISSSAPITQSTWLDLSMKIDSSNLL